MTAAWRLTVLAFTLVAAAIWHVSLLWIGRETPAVLGGWLLAAFALVLAGRTIARRVPPASRSRLMRQAVRLDATGLVFVAFLLLLLLLFHVGFERAASDGRSYFVQVRSLVMDRDLDLANDEEIFGGHGARQYAFGAPVLWTPFFVAGHAWISALNLLGDDLRADGYYYPYQRAIGLATLWYGFVGLVLIYRVLRRYFDRPVSAIATLGLCSASFLIWYLTVDNSMVHGVSMFATTLFLYLWHRSRPAPSRRQWIWMGAAAGLMTMTRWQNAVFVVLPLADLLWTTWRARPAAVGAWVGSTARSLALFGAAALVAFAPQLLFWKAVYGSFVYLPTREHGFEPGLIPPFMADVLFSSNRGLLSWTPIVTASLAGLAIFARRQGAVALVLAGGFLGQLWVNGAVEIWWGGVGFGARRFANSMLAFAVGLAALLAWMRRRPLAAPVLLLAGLLVYNAVFMAGYRRATLSPVEGITFQSVTDEVYERLGNPFSLPMGAWVAWRYDVGLPVYDRLRGRTYNNLDIDVGGPDDDRFLGHGWSGREQDPAFSFRWSDADSSVVLVPLKTNVDPYVLEIDWAPFLGPGLPAQDVDIEVNGTLVASRTLTDGGMRTDSIEIPVLVLRVNLNQVRFRYRRAASPAELGLSSDERRLAIQVAGVRVEREVDR